MFESVVAVLLNRLLGKYIEDLDTEKLNVGIISGDVNLTELKLKPEALYELELPIQVQIGVLGKLKLKVPWTSLYTSPISITIEDVLVLAGPVISNEVFDEVKETKLLRSVKRKILQDLEGNSEPSTAPNNFTEKLLSTIVNNLQVFIRNIHIRYEDEITLPARPLSCGICVQGISIENTNNKWKPCATPAGAITAYQLARVESISIYWNTHISSASNVTSECTPQQFYAWRNSMLRGLETFSMHDEDFEFVVKPFSLKVKAIISRSTEGRCPRLLVDAVLQDSAVQITNEQIASINQVTESFRRMSINRLFRRFHPGYSVQGHAKEWWLYSLAAVMKQRVIPYTWHGFKENRENYKRYKEIYKKSLIKPNDTELRLDLQKIEDCLEITCIAIAREKAKIELQKTNPEMIFLSECLSDGWNYKNLNSTDDCSNYTPPCVDHEFVVKCNKPRGLWKQLSSPEKKKICEMIGLMEENKSERPKQYIEQKLNFTLGNCTVSLINKGHEILVGALSQLLVSLEKRPSAHGYKLSVRAESLVIEGCGRDTELAPLVSVPPSKSHDVINVLTFDLEKNPTHVKVDYLVCGTLEALEIVYNQQALSELLSFSQVTSCKSQQMNALKEKVWEMGKLLSEDMISRKTLIHINMDIKGPFFIIPEYGSIQRGGNLLVFEMGHIKIRSDLQVPNISMEDVTLMELEEKLYDRLHFNISALQLLFCDSGEEWRDYIRVLDSDSHIIPKVQAQMVFSNSIWPYYKLLPKHKLNLSITSLKLNISDRKIGMLLDFMDNFPLPKRCNISVMDYIQVPKKITKLARILEKDHILKSPSSNQLRLIRNLIVRNYLQMQRTESSSSSKEAPKIESLENHKFLVSSDHSEEDEFCARAVDLPGFEDNVSPHNTIQMLVRFVVGDIVLALSRSNEHTDKPYVMLHLGKVCLDTALMQYGPAIQLSIKGIAITDKFHVGAEGKHLELLSTDKSQDVATLLYRQVRPDCPDFKSHCHSVEHSAVLDLSSVFVLLHREGIAMLEKYLAYIFHKIFCHKLVKQAIEYFAVCEWLSRYHDQSDPPIPTGATKFSYSARLTNLQVKLCDNDNEILEIILSNLESECAFKANERMVLRISLDGVGLEDLSHATLYPKLVTVDEDRVLDLKYVRHAPRLYSSSMVGQLVPNKSGQDVKADGSLRIYIGRLHATLLYKTLIDIQQFLQTFIPTKVHSKSFFFTRFVEDNIESAKKCSSKIHLSIEIHAPTILLPQRSSSLNLLVINLGDLTVENFFKTQEPSLRIVDNILIRLQAVSLTRAVMTLPGSLRTQEPILEPLSVRLDIKRMVMSTQCPPYPLHNTWSGQTPLPLQLEVDAVVDVVHINIGQQDLSTILAVWSDNLAEGRSRVSDNTSFMLHSPLDLPIPATCSEDAAVKKLEAFFCQSETIRKLEFIRISFDGLQLRLYNNLDELLSSPVREMSKGLCILDIGEINVNLTSMSDGCMEAELYVEICTIQDARPGPRAKNIFESHFTDLQIDSAPISVSVPPLLDVTWRLTSDRDCSIHACVESIILNLSVSFVMQLISFFYDSLPGEKGGFINHGYTCEAPKTIQLPNSIKPTDGFPSCGEFSCRDLASITISLQLRKPEIRFYPENVSDSVNSTVLILRSDILFDYSRQKNQESWSISIAALQLTSCCQDGKGLHGPTRAVLWPCNLDLCKTLKTCDHELNISANIPEIKLFIAPSTVHVIIDIIEEISATLYPETDIETMTAVVQGNEKADPEDLWTPKKIIPLVYTNSNSQCFYKKSYLNFHNQSEMFMITLPNIEVTFELSIGLPVLTFKSHLEFSAFNWSTQLHSHGEATLQASIFNEKWGIWEPLIEPTVQKEGVFTPWEVMFKIFEAKALMMFSNKKSSVETDTFADELDYVAKLKKKYDSETSEDENGAAMFFIRCPDESRDANEITHSTPEDSNSDTDDGVMEKLASAVGQLFTGDSSDDARNYDTSGASSVSDNSQIDGHQHVEPDAKNIGKNLEGIPVRLDTIDSICCNEDDLSMAQYIIFDARHELKITLTQQSINLLRNMMELFLNKNNNVCIRFDRPIDLVNEVWPMSLAEIYLHHKKHVHADVLASAQCGVDSRPSTPGSEDVPLTPSSDGCWDLTELTTGAPQFMSMTFVVPNVDELLKKVTEEKLTLHIDGFDDLTVCCPNRECSKLHLLQPHRHGTNYHIHMQTFCKGNTRKVQIRSPLQVHNGTCYALTLCYRCNALESLEGVPQLGDAPNPFENISRIAVLEPDQLFSVPLYVAYHSELYLMPADNDSYKSSKPMYWKELVRDRSPKELTCVSKDPNDTSVFSLRVILQEGTPQSIVSRSIPNYLIQIVPPLTIHNLVPCALIIYLPAHNIESVCTNDLEKKEIPIRLEAGEFTNVFLINIAQPYNIRLEIFYMNLNWYGSCSFTPEMKERTLNMVTESDTDGGNKQLALSISIDRTKSVDLFFHAKYWIVNKTGLPVQLRGSMNSTLHEPFGEEPLLFCYRRSCRKKCRLRAYQSSWSSAFSLDSTGIAGLVICRDRERKKKYRILRTVSLSQLCPQLSKIVTFLPYFIIRNETKRSLRYMEINERADLWFDLPPGACIPFWPDTDSMKVVCKLRDSALMSQCIPITDNYCTVLRMDRGSALCVEVTGGRNTPFTIVFRPYVVGSAPIRVDNLCEDLCLKLHQEELGQVALLNHLQSVLYTWDDPCRRRVLVWNVYNNKSKGFIVDIQRDGYGSEHVILQTVKNKRTKIASSSVNNLKRQQKQSLKLDSKSSSSSEDVDLESDVDHIILNKKLRQDKVIVYWISYLEDQQRVLVFTQNERIFRQFQMMIESEKSKYETFVSFSRVSLSLCMAKDDLIKELMYMSLTDRPAIWEVNVSNKWKQFPIELSTWIEEKFRTDNKKCQLKDYVKVDFVHMHMTKPFFGDIRRTYDPAVWLHYRKSEYQNYTHLKVHRFQIDNQLNEAIFTTVVYPTPLPLDLVKQFNMKPCLELSAFNTYRHVYNQYIYKHIKIILQEFCLQLDKGFVAYISDVLDSIETNKSHKAANLRADLNLVHMPLLQHSKPMKGSKKIIIEYLYLSPLQLKVSLSNKCYDDKWGSFTDAFQSASGYKKLYNSDLLELLFNSRISAITEIKHISLRTSSYEQRGICRSLCQLSYDTLEHYSIQILQQCHVLILGFDVLGSPFAELPDFTYESTLYEPLKSNCTSSEISISLSLEKFVGSLLGHTMGGSAGSLMLLMHSLGDLLTTLSFEDEYKKKRRSENNLQESTKPQSLLMASRSFFMGVGLGLSGVVVKPLSGGQRDGVEGFLIGTGKGLLGLLTRPEINLADSALLAYEGMRQAANIGDDIIFRIRLPRHCNYYFGVMPFSQYDAMGQHLLSVISKGHYAQEPYIAYGALDLDGRTILLVTLNRVFLLNKSRIWGIWEVEWSCLLNDILAITVVCNGNGSSQLQISLKQDTGPVPTTGHRRLIEGIDEEAMRWLCMKIELSIVLNMENNHLTSDFLG